MAEFTVLPFLNHLTDTSVGEDKSGVDWGERAVRKKVRKEKFEWELKLNLTLNHPLDHTTSPLPVQSNLLD